MWRDQNQMLTCCNVEFDKEGFNHLSQIYLCQKNLSKVALLWSLEHLAEFWNVCTRPTTARGGLGLSVEATERRLRLLERHFRVLPDSLAVYQEWKALVLAYNITGVQVHDARLVAAMKAHGVSHILTLNVTDFKRYSSIIALAPEDIAWLMDYKFADLTPLALDQGLSYRQVQI